MILPDVDDLSWQDDALCLTSGISTELFFPLQGDSAGQKARARSVCAQCPVKAECLEYALAVPVMDVFGRSTTWVHGVWGGTMPSEREQMRAKRKASYV